MTKLRLTQLTNTVPPVWYTEPAVDSVFALSLEAPSFVVAGPSSRARDASALTLLDVLCEQKREVVAVYVSGSPDGESHLVERNGSPLLPQGEAMLSRGARVRWLQLSASVERALLVRAFSVASREQVLLVEGNIALSCVSPARSIFVYGDGFASRADVASRRVRERVDLELGELSLSLARAMLKEVFT